MAGVNNGVAIGEASGGDPIHTGMREGELLGLKWDDVDLECGVLRLWHGLVREGGKTALGELKTPKSRRSIKLTRAGIGGLRSHL